MAQRRSPQQSFERALRESKQAMCPVGWVKSLIDALRVAVDPQTDSELAARELGRQIRKILTRYIPVGEGTPWCMPLSDYCDRLGITKKKRETYRKRAARRCLPGAFKIGGSWFVCGFSPLAHA